MQDINGYWLQIDAIYEKIISEMYLKFTGFPICGMMFTGS
jgi:hypothetical protein